MGVMKVDAATLSAWVEDLIQSQTVIGVQAKGARFEFAPLSRAQDLRLDYDVTLLPPKTFLQPPREKVLTFSKSTGYTTVVEDNPRVLLGVHPYDAVAIAQMDAIFEEGLPDVHYAKRRKNTAIVAVDPLNAGPDTFAGHMGTHSTEEGCDILLTCIGEAWLVDAKTDVGCALLGRLAVAEDAGAPDLMARQGVWDQNRLRLRKHDLKAMPETWPGLLDKGMEHPVWSEKAKQCFSCGSCNLTCPTCYCFDMCDDVNWDLQSGTRSRVWDGCLLVDFAKVAGNHNFRKDRAARYRHRYYRKGKYVPSKIGGRMACVGCGRCITACVTKIANPVEIFNRLQEGK